MNLFTLPAWIKPHLFEDKRFDDLSEADLDDLRNAIRRFSDSDPEVSVVIPAWNEADNIYRTLSSLAASTTALAVEILVINNNSTDGTQRVLDVLGVKSHLQSIQGTPHARQLGLEKAKGKYHLCADSDTFYPPDWIDLMVAPMQKDAGVTGVYGIYSFIPPKGQGRAGLWLYEFFTTLVIYYRKRKKEFMNVYGFNMGFMTEVGRRTGGFRVSGERVYANVSGSDFANEAEDGRMALNLKKEGELFWVTHPKARVFTSPRRLMDDGSVAKAFVNRVRRQLGLG